MIQEGTVVPPRKYQVGSFYVFPIRLRRDQQSFFLF
jgi:hypothetical protein